MDKEILVEAFRRVLVRLDREAGPVALLMLLAPDTSGESWTVLCSASGFDRERRSATLHWLTTALQDALDAKTLHTIRRASVLRTDDPFVQAVNRAFHVTSSAMELFEANVSGFEIPMAILFHSAPAAAQKIAAG